MKNTAASTMLDAIRVIASQAVCFGHAISFFGILPFLQPPHAPFMQIIAVQVFFVLSGFLIASALERDKSFAEYAVDRIARIYSAYLPALLFIALVAPDQMTGRSFIGNFAMVQGMKVVPLSAPLWTLAIEWHIYFFVGALVFLRQSPWLILVCVPFAFLPIRYLFSDVGPTTGSGLFALWLMGYAGYFYRRFFSSWAIGIVSISAYFFFIRPNSEYDLLIYPMLTIAFLCFVGGAYKHRHINIPGLRFFAGYSFTLFLIHYSILSLLTNYLSGWTGVAIGVFLSNAAAFLIASRTEMRHKELAGWLKTRMRYLLHQHQTHPSRQQ